VTNGRKERYVFFVCLPNFSSTLSAHQLHTSKNFSFPFYPWKHLCGYYIFVLYVCLSVSGFVFVQEWMTQKVLAFWAPTGRLLSKQSVFLCVTILQECQTRHARSIITAFPSENWRRPPGRPRTTWMKTIKQDLRSNNLSLDEAITVAQNRPLWRLMSAFGATHP